MITTKKELKQYIKLDLQNNSFQLSDRIKRIFGMGMISFFVNLRKYEYAINNKKRLSSFFRRIKHHFFLGKMHCQIPPNVFGAGLRLEHPIGIIVNPNARVGGNCVIWQLVTIGNNGHNDISPIIGDNVYIGAGSIVIGDISIGNNCVIGAGAVVINSFPDNLTIVGVPAKQVKHNPLCEAYSSDGTNV